jgi:DHA1 family tetracycline resistance protein-like MFS transporter
VSQPVPTPPRRAYATIFLTILLDLIGFGMIVPLLPFYAQRFAAPTLWIGLLFSSYSLAQLICAPLLGRLSDRVGRRPVLLISIAGNVAAHLLFWRAGSFGWLLAARTLSGMAASNYGIAQAYLADVTPPSQRSRAMGVVGAAFGLGFVLGPALGGLLSHFVSQQAVPLTAAGLSALNLVLASLWLRESLPPEVRARLAGAPWLDLTALPRLWRRIALRDLLTLSFLVTFCFSMMESTLALFGQRRFGFGGVETAGLFVFSGVLVVIVQGALIGRLVERFGEGRLIQVGIVAIGLGLALLPWSPGLASLLCALALLSVGSALYTPSALGLLSRLTDEAEQGGTIGLQRSASALARTLGPTAGAFLFGTAGIGWPFWTSALLLVGAWAVARSLVRHIP